MLGVAVALLPSWLKIPFYRRVYGYRIGKGVRIGLSPFIGVKRCVIGDFTRIGSFNAFYEIEQLVIGERVRIGFLNLVRGGDSVQIGSYASVLRQNVINAIIEKDFVDPVFSRISIGEGAVVTSGHWLDFSAGIELGAHSILGGRNSSLWTHNRQRGRGIEIGCHCYIGSEVRVAPGVRVAPFSIVALGAVLSGQFASERSLIGGNPAKVVRPLSDSDMYLVLRKTRGDIPDELASAQVPADLREFALPRISRGLSQVANEEGEPGSRKPSEQTVESGT